eukprot:CAMPEP_0184858294 /NCGR_PEP_ID=MMETSP0580-20130426/3418_1 /TAXON_ID=1118495 /ORGANISM="Dactyliosolen fragilissimus" /LENGTH=1062 /DNA_ID=CAMNT_0027354377 /DNA_START=45 /DNA_END=3230 /DNA_ORIENTATION=+
MISSSRSSKFESKEEYSSSFIQDNDDSLDKLRFSDLTKLYGRQSEMEKLKKSFERVNSILLANATLQDFSLRKQDQSDTDENSNFRCNNNITNVSEIILISGSSGVGKTALVNQLKEPILTSGGFFAMGKFDLRQTIEPYTAIIQAFGQLCNQIIEKVDQALITKIEVFIGEESSALADVIPNLNKIVKNQHNEEKSMKFSALETRNRFSFMIRKFVKAICFVLLKPVVIFLDDLQWADTSSLELVEAFSKDEEILSLQLIGAYRTNEVGPTHRTAISLENIKNLDGVRFTEIKLDALNVVAINEFLSELLNLRPSRTQTLSEIIVSKTHGNIFFVIFFLKALNNEGLLEFSYSSFQWIWKEQMIKEKNVTDNVAEYMVSKLESLPLLMRELLKVASCLGSNFSKRLLQFATSTYWNEIYGSEKKIDNEKIDETPILTSLTDDNISKCLDKLVTEGFLEKVEAKDSKDKKYRFMHDQIQHSASSLILAKNRQNIMYQIGRKFVREFSDDELDEHIYSTVDLCNYGVKVLDLSTDERKSLALLNLRAGQKAMLSAAYEPAATYFSICIDLLTANDMDNGWDHEYEMFLHLYLQAAQAELANGKFAKVKVYVDIILFNAKKLEDKVPAYLVYSESLLSDGKKMESLQSLIDLITLFGIRLPKNVFIINVLMKYMKTRSLLKKYDKNHLKDYAIATDEKAKLKMQILYRVAISAYYTKPEIMPLIVFNMVQETLVNGITVFSSLGFGLYGLICGVVGNNFKEAAEFGKLSLDVLERFPNRRKVLSTSIVLIETLINHNVKPIQNSLRPLVSAYNIGMEAGEIESSMVSMHNWLHYSLLSGGNLEILGKNLEKCCKHMLEYNHTMSHFATLPLWQFTLNIMGEGNSNPIVFSGKAIESEDEHDRICESRNELQLKYVFHYYRMWMCLCFDEVEHANDIAKICSGICKLSAGHFVVNRYTFHKGLINFLLAEKSSGRTRKKYHNVAVKCLKLMERFCKGGNVNCHHMLKLLEAEDKALNENWNEAQILFKDAIQNSTKLGFLHDKALANERCAISHIRENDDKSTYW